MCVLRCWLPMSTSETTSETLALVPALVGLSHVQHTPEVVCVLTSKWL